MHPATSRCVSNCETRRVRNRKADWKRSHSLPTLPAMWQSCVHRSWLWRGGNYQDPLSSVAAWGLDGSLSLFSHAGTCWKWLTRWAASLWLQLLICLDSMGWIEGGEFVHVCVERVGVFIFLVRECNCVIKRRRLEGVWSRNQTEDRAERESASSGSHSAGEEGCPSVMGTFASLYIPVTLAQDSGLCRLPSMAAPSHVTYLTWQQIWQCSARDFWKQALCSLRAMFICNQTKVNGRILPCNTAKQGFIIHTPWGFMDAISTHHMTALSANFPSAMSHAATSHYKL